ncbi:dephospho-CoA kinase [Tanacetum coccineum]
MNTKDQSKEGKKEAEATSWPTWEPAIDGYLEFLVHRLWDKIPTARTVQQMTDIMERQMEEPPASSPYRSSEWGPQGDTTSSYSRGITICLGFRLSYTNARNFAVVSSSAEYIIQHFIVATVCRTLEGTVRNMYATGKVTMAMQMVPNKWLIELAVGGHKVVAGSDGNVVWRHTPWLESHAAQGGVRPLRHALQARTYITKT